MSDLDKKYPLRLDTRIDFKNLIPHFYISDNETSDFYIKFTNDNQPVSVENVVIAIVVVNPNSQINSSLLDVNIDKGLIYCNLPNELKNVVGVYKAKIMCISEEERLVSNTFEYKVDMDEFAILNEVVENSDEILLLTQMLSQINVISTEEGKRIENENIRLVNETERTTNETNRINNEDERKSNELERIANETKRNNDENERQLKEAERNENELNRESQELIRQNNEVDRTAYDEVLSNNEEERIANESDRIAHEESRANSENIRINNENNRERNEQIRQNNEENRKFEFTMQSQSLTNLSMGVNAVKEDILKSESDRKSSEEERKSNELLRISNEDARTSNEENRVRYEESRVEAESTRSTNEETRERNENIRKTNETTRVSNENKRITAESTRSSNENIRVNAENRRRNEHTARMAEIDEALANLPNSLPVANQTTLGGIKVGAGLSITADGILSATGGGTADSVNGIPSLVGSNENVVKIWELEDGVYNLSGILKYRYDYYSTETGGTLEGWQIEGLYIIYNTGDDPNNVGRTIKICKNLKYNFYFKYSLLNGTIENSRYDPEYIKEDNSNPIGEEEAIIVLPNDLTASDYYNLPVGLYRVTTDFFFDATTNCELRNGLTNDMLTLPNGSLISCMGQGLIINLSYSVYLILNDTGEVYVVGSTNNAWTGELATVAISGSYNDLTDKPTIPHYNETLMFEISGETDYGNFYANRYFNISALSLDETKSYVGKHKPIMDFPDELIHEFVYNKEANALMDEINSVYIYNHKSYNGTNFIEDENSAVLTYDIKPMAMSSGYNGYFRLYEIEKLELNNNCLSDDVSIKNSLTVGSRIGDIGKYSVAEGNENTASGGCSHAEGISTIASGDYSHAEGDNTTANGVASHAEGVNTTASGDFSHAEGGNTIASTDFSHAEGYYTIASTDFQHVQGRFNIEDTGRIYAHIVGNGMSDTERRNAHTLDWNGNAWYQGKLSQDGTPTEDKDLATKKYVDDSIATVNADTIDNLHIWTGTQSQYDALGTKDSNTIYLIKEG